MSQPMMFRAVILKTARREIPLGILIVTAPGPRLPRMGGQQGPAYRRFLDGCPRTCSRH